MIEQPVENHGVIGDLNTVALVGKDGSIDFMCFPRFDCRRRRDRAARRLECHTDGVSGKDRGSGYPNAVLIRVTARTSVTRCRGEANRRFIQAQGVAMRKQHPMAVTLVAFAAFVLLAVPAASRAEPQKDRALMGVLLGENEISPTGDSGAGAPNGFGSATAVVNGSLFCFGLTYTNVVGPAIAAHIHRGKAGENGPIVLTFLVPFSSLPNGAISGCGVVNDPALLDELFSHPHEFYWNVHSAFFQAGAIRGQVFLEK